MAGMADWGGGINYSELFRGLYNDFVSDVEAATARQMQRSEEEQAADDANEYDKWKNGIISDGDWLDYLRQRERETRGDPKEHEQWVETLREHSSAIADAQMESDFQTGKVSIHHLIAYYQRKMKKVKRNSPAYRELAARYTQLVDARKQGYGSAGGYSSGGGSRSYSSGGSSSSYSSGGSSGGARYYPQGHKRVAGQRGPVDPINSMRAAGGYSNYMEGLFGDLKRIDAINDQIDAGRDFVTDPLTGEQFKVTPEFTRAIDKQFLRTEDMIAAAKWADNDADGAVDALNARSAYLQDRNSMRGQEAWDEASSSFMSTIMAASQIADPEQRAQVYTRAFQMLETTATRITGNNRGESELITPELQEDIQTTLKIGEAFGSHSMSPDQRAQVLGEAMDNLPYGFRWTKDEIQTFADGDLDTGLIGAMETQFAREGLADGSMALFNDGMVTRAMTYAQINEASPPDANGRPTVARTFQRVGGATLPVFQRTIPVASDYFAYQYADGDKKGQLVPSSEVNGMTEGGLNQLLNSGKIVRAPIDLGWTSIVTPDGRTWYQDPETNLWYRDELPVHLGEDKTGGLMIDDGGSPMTNDFQGFASEGGVLMPFSGVSFMEMQRLVDEGVANGEINLDNYRTRDETGALDNFGRPSTENMYWSPHLGQRLAGVDPAKGMQIMARMGMGHADNLDVYAHNNLHDVWAEQQKAKIEDRFNEWRASIPGPFNELIPEAGKRQAPFDQASGFGQQISGFSEFLGIRTMRPEEVNRAPLPTRRPTPTPMPTLRTEASIERSTQRRRPRTPTIPPVRVRVPTLQTEASIERQATTTRNTTTRRRRRTRRDPHPVLNNNLSGFLR